MKAILNHAFPMGYKEFKPIYDDSKGGNIIHQVDSVYYFSDFTDQRFRMAFSIAVNKTEIEASELKEVSMIGAIGGEPTLEYVHQLSHIPNKDEFEDAKIYKWTDYIVFSFKKSGLITFRFTFKTNSGQSIPIEGLSSAYFKKGESPISHEKSWVDKLTDWNKN